MLISEGLCSSKLIQLSRAVIGFPSLVVVFAFLVGYLYFVGPSIISLNSVLGSEE